MLFLLPLALLAAEEKEQPDMVKISKTIGHMMGQNLNSLGLDLDMKAVTQGLQDSASGVPAPMTESECIQAITTIQEASFQKISQENLQKAEAFLKNNRSTPGLVELEEGKLQYIVLEKGTGAVVESTFSPTIHYCGTFIDGKVFGESQDDEVFTLSSTIEGLQKAIVGMKEGEKRRIFIHPELGYGASSFLPPNSLLTFEIEIITANTQKVEEAPPADPAA